MSQNNTNRDIRRFETDADGNTTRVLLNTDEPLGLLDGDYQEQLEELENRLNAITGGAYSNTVQIAHGGTGAETAQTAFDNLISSLNSSLASMTPYFIVKRGADGAGAAISADDAVNALGALKASNNLSDLSNTLTGLQNLYHNVPMAESQGGIPLKAWFDSLYVMLGHNVGLGGVNYRVEPNYYTLKSLVDNYLSEYLLKASNNLSDLSDLSASLGNLFNDADTFEPVPGPPIDTQLYNLELYLGYLNGPPSSPFTVPKKITVEYLYENYILPVLNTEYGMTKDEQTNLYDFTGNAATADLSSVTEQTLLNYDGQPGGRKELTLYNKFTQSMSIYSNISDGTATIDLTYGVTGDKRVILVGVCPEITNGYGNIIVKSYDITHSKDSSDNLSNELSITYDATIGGASMAIRFNAIYYVAERIN